MPYRYSPARKDAVLDLLQTNHGNVVLTSAQTGFLVRTLCSWRKSLSLQQHTPSPSALPQNPPEFTDDLETLSYVRRQIKAELACTRFSLTQN